MRVLAIGAHPDDIEVCCSGTLAKCVKRSDTVIGLSVTKARSYGCASTTVSISPHGKDLLALQRLPVRRGVCRGLQAVPSLFEGNDKTTVALTNPHKEEM